MKYITLKDIKLEALLALTSEPKVKESKQLGRDGRRSKDRVLEDHSGICPKHGYRILPCSACDKDQ